MKTGSNCFPMLFDKMLQRKVRLRSMKGKLGVANEGSSFICTSVHTCRVVLNVCYARANISIT